MSEICEPDQVGFLVAGDRCDRCGDVNYDEETCTCLTCTYPDDPCSASYLKPGDPLPAELLWECDVPGCDTPKLMGFNHQGGSSVSLGKEFLADLISEHYANKHPGFLEGTR